MDKNKKEVISFRKSVDPGESGKMTERVKAKGTVEGFKVRFYAGQEEDLRVRVYLRKVGNIIEELITYQGNNFLSGDDDYFIYDVITPVKNDDEIVVEYENVTAEEVGAYTLSVDVSIDYYLENRRF